MRVTRSRELVAEGYSPSVSQAFIESWFGKLKERCVWLHEFETLDEAREVIGTHIDG
jgi:hypothetical protein